jgi:hypothetical protein
MEDIGRDYRTGDNGRMKRCTLALLICLLTQSAYAWNAAGHRLVALIAWEQLSPATQAQISQSLAIHPDYPRWQEKAKSTLPQAILAEAATWPDSIRNDPRFYDETRETPRPPIPGWPDNARHKQWHYVDFDAQGKVIGGEIDRQIERISHLLRSTRQNEEITYYLPWLLHLVADIHQPLHVGNGQDEGGNLFEIENPLTPHRPFSNLHSYWDDLPGPSSLRGQRLENQAKELVDRNTPPNQGTVNDWRRESRELHRNAYPEKQGSLLPTITEDFQIQVRRIAEQRLVDAGFRLGRLLEQIFSARVSRETP